ncbi:hypothetical protein [Nocardia sp. NPDC020380]|uniref:hypothetical protein n=1 Tax=Nocardia sp. NPDC020380 TaxID=3364309 RepID=UPI00379F526A
MSVESERVFRPDGAEAFEDGTIGYLGLPAIELGLRQLRRTGMPLIHTRVRCLTEWLLTRLTTLRHSNGSPLTRLYGPADGYRRGGTISLNFLDPEGCVIDERRVEHRARTWRISLRTGCFCNPGAGQVALGIDKATITANFDRTQRPDYDRFLHDMGMTTGGAVRVSLGLATTFDDVYRFLDFAETFRDNASDVSGLPPRRHC